ncbi:PQQ-binding-like beta-propeller repeat protein [Microbacterium sp. Marseille-Q6965]|uniref:outer membrane protein assembly factor BamB family protein n=1 Tax=Microbacterium sp. Marseille-Q6965 TaxID=2965072 RepID=UPI0021B71F54|nr:PQQ-binding-like beta-propeller repeat protein [Microbacterium sp. Marseille-Q6965]
MAGDDGEGGQGEGDGLDWSHLRSPLEGLPPMPGVGGAEARGGARDELVVPPRPVAPEPAPEPWAPPDAAPSPAAVNAELPPYARAAASSPHAGPPPYGGATLRARPPAQAQGYPVTPYAHGGTVSPRTRPGRGLAIAALAMAAVAALLALVPLAGLLAIPLAIAAAVLAIVALARRAAGRGISVAALIISTIAFILPWVVTVVSILAIGDGMSSGGTDPGPDLAEAPEAAPAWTVSAPALRPGEDDVEFRRTVDGTIDDAQLIEAGDTWAVVSAVVGDDLTPRAYALHGLDAQTGQERWRRESGDLLRCARQPLGGSLACAEASLDAEGVPAGFRLLALDAATGEVLAETPVDALVSAIAVSGGTVVVIDEPIDGSGLRVLGFSSALDPAWVVDLSAEENRRAMLSDGSLVWRHEPWRTAPGLDRTRLRHVGPEGSILALWAGQATAFVDVGTGRLWGMPRCSRLVDDGQRLWCNEGEHAAIYSYELDRLGQTPDGQRLMFPSLAPYRDSDVSPALTSGEDGVVARPDPQGNVGDPLIDMGLGDAFGMELQPTAFTSQGRTYLAGAAGLARLSADGAALDWTAEGIEPRLAPFEVDGVLYAPDVMLEDSTADVAALEPDAGTVVSAFATPLEARELYVTPAGRVVGQWADALGRYEALP